MKNLNAEQKKILTVILNMIIPRSEDGKMPGAIDVGFFTFIDNTEKFFWIKEGINKIIDEAQNKYCNNFATLDVSEQKEIINQLRRKYLRFFNGLTIQVMQCYYKNEKVLELIGVEERPPFPNGYQIEKGDLSLLEPVFLRGKIYRD